MACGHGLPFPKIDALRFGAHRLVGGHALEEGERDVSGTETAGKPCGGIPLLTDEALFDSAGVRIAFAGRDGGVSTGPFASLNCGLHVGDAEADVRENRRLLFEALGLEGVTPIVPSQVHGTAVLTLGASDSPAAVQERALEGADGLVVAAPAVAALLNFADCLPLVLVAPNGAFAVAHAGWRGAVARIASAAVSALVRADGSNPSQVNAYIGPHIRSECFEVGPEVAGRFASEFGREVLADDRHVSLAAAVRADLESAGVEPARIADAGICTVCNSDRFFSYRASGGTCGRHAALAVRVRERRA